MVLTREWSKNGSEAHSLQGSSPLTLLHSEQPKLHRVLAILSATGLIKYTGKTIYAWRYNVAVSDVSKFHCMTTS